MKSSKKTAFYPIIALCTIAAGLAVSGLSNSVSAETGSPASAEMSSAGSIEEFKLLLDRKVPEWQKTYDVPGVAVGLVHNGQVAYSLNYGVADTKSGEPVSNDTLFQAGSISKSLTAWGILHLAEEGRLSPDDSVTEYITRWKLPGSEFDEKGVTLRRLLSHTAGLPAHQGYLGSAPGEPLPTLEESLSGDGGSNPVKLATAPGTEAVYSGAGYTLLQLVIEEVTGLPFEQYMDQQVLKPLGMNASTFGDTAANPLMSQGYGYFGQPLPDYQFTEKAAAGLSTTSADLMKLIMASMGEKNEPPAGSGVISEPLIHEMQTPVLADNGLGIFTRTLSSGQVMLYHPGDNRGFHSFYGFVPKTGDGLVILTNSENGIDLRQDIYHAWVQSLTGSVPDGYDALNAARKTNAYIAYAVAALLGIYVLVLVLRLLKGRRVFITKHNRQPFLWLGLRVILLTATGTLLFLASYSWSILGLSAGLKNTVLWVFAWHIALFIAGFFPKLKTPRKRAADASDAMS
ncbi:serine hydrolase domain-containing protein [Paenibacillus sp. HW567]|uniref:serine hydrolase domain-containing protein n=1 Tax=Paenibacillus sp. HW567 TaxID=1034769 RepID=UPI000362A6EB|nr:serine hydrolase domain-containing protein [Paenibacillus sp. HW567]